MTTPKASEYGGDGYEVIEHGHRFDCANVSGHEEHAQYSDSLQILEWHKNFNGDFKKPRTVNGHPTKPVQRTVTYGPWEDM